MLSVEFLVVFRQDYAKAVGIFGEASEGIAAIDEEDLRSEN